VEKKHESGRLIEIYHEGSLHSATPTFLDREYIFKQGGAARRLPAIIQKGRCCSTANVTTADPGLLLEESRDILNDSGPVSGVF
jgi:hypothetical protein